MSNETCYMCDAPATSKEHAPPKCLFPEGKHLSAPDNQRISLITVPACDAHNTQKSGDDEYLMYLFTMLPQTNSYGKVIFNNKVIRASQRKPKLAERIFENTIKIDGKEGNEVDRQRIDTSIGLVARAIFFHETQAKWTHPMQVNSTVYEVPEEQDGIVIDRADIIANRKKYSQTISDLLINLEWKGANPKIFKYKIMVDSTDLFLVMQFCFYEEITFDIVSHPSLWNEPFSV
ncbi:MULTISPECIES: hypothetical protein [Pseudomonas]|uniref:Uncharacterized protein n=1 Tax=Pseudomonas kurunegalensis TaxID=485880 RepID=A0ACC5UP11_9PSED|nr:MULTISPECIES: hypothetical protein [Pseudomonas]MBV4516175.1 hypothetical protein [Pseudomonas kurunegalensis]